MRRAFLNLRHAVPERRLAFKSGLERIGYEVFDGLPSVVRHTDALVLWNRIGSMNEVAKKFSNVLVAENAVWGNDFRGGHWYSLARNYHNTAGMVPHGGPDRWHSLGVELAPWRTEGETVVLPSRGIGSPPTAMPRDWPNRQNGRIRPHPGRSNVFKPLEEDLKNCGRVVTWGSGAAVQALMWGIPVESHMPNWIAACEPTDSSRLAMFERLSWAQWKLSEIEAGEPFKRLLSESPSDCL